MRISAVEEYGLRCLLDLARQGSGGQLSISDIAEREGLSAYFILRDAEGGPGAFTSRATPSFAKLLEATESGATP